MRTFLVTILVAGAWALSWKPSHRPLMVRGGDDEDEALFGEEGQQSISDLLGGLSGFPNGFNGDMAEYEKMMETFMDSPLMQEFLSDPEKMEMTRQALLNNPMALQLMKQMPGLEEILHDKEKWRERMLESKAQFDAMRKAKLEDSEPADDFED